LVAVAVVQTTVVAELLLVALEAVVLEAVLYLLVQQEQLGKVMLVAQALLILFMVLEAVAERAQ
jgi:hypothetical protein